MIRSLLVILLISSSLSGVAQPSDFIALKKNNNRTIRTYFPGSSIDGLTNSGFVLHGTIKRIANDTIEIEQLQVRQIATPFGVPSLDTVRYTIQVYYKDIRQFYYADNSAYGSRRRRESFASRILPPVMMAGGLGYIILEGVNTIYRKESFTEGNKLTTMAVAAGVAATGFIWNMLNQRKYKAGGKYRVVYVSMTDK